MAAQHFQDEAVCNLMQKALKGRDTGNFCLWTEITAYLSLIKMSAGAENDSITPISNQLADRLHDLSPCVPNIVPLFS